jgi:uncharacterized membrane protein
MTETIRNPIEWGADQARLTARLARAAVDDARDPDVGALAVRRIGVADLREVLAQGWRDFVENRTDVLFLCIIYPLAGLLIARLAFSSNLLPLVFPFVSGFAIVGPFAASGLYELSRLRERGEPATWSSAFGVFASPSIAAIIKLALVMTGLFVLWLAAAYAIFALTLGPDEPASASAFVSDVLHTPAGWAMILVGGGVGFLFALLSLSISVVSFPLLLDRRVSITTAVRTSLRAVAENPVPMLAWGLVVAALLVLGTIPALAGLIVAMPVLGHATWHLYRKVVV